MFFPVITKNSNCEMFQLRILGSLKNPIFRWGGGVFTKNQYRAKGVPKKGGLGSLQIEGGRGGGLAKKGG